MTYVIKVILDQIAALKNSGQNLSLRTASDQFAGRGMTENWSIATEL